MARKKRVVLVCDRHRGEVDATATVEVIVDGERRKVDLCSEHLADFRKTVRPWLGLKDRGGRRPAAGAGRQRKKAADAGESDANEIRAWARENGYEVGDRGRIPVALREAYEATKQ
ncbi:Lsr2 family protein [soil metagenome]